MKQLLLSGKLQNGRKIRFIQHLERCGNYRKISFTWVRSVLSIIDSSHLSPHFNANARALRARPAFFVICLHLFTKRM